jgi:hypothetical protein
MMLIAAELTFEFCFPPTSGELVYNALPAAAPEAQAH